MSSQVLNATRWFPHHHLVQGDQKLQLKNLLKIWKAKTLKHGKTEKLHGHAIVASERLLEKINESVTCHFCQGSVELVENLRSKDGLGCFSARTKAVRRSKLILHFRQQKKAGRS